MSQQQNLYICIYVPQSLLQKQSAVLKSKIPPLLGNFALTKLDARVALLVWHCNLFDLGCAVEWVRSFSSAG